MVHHVPEISSVLSKILTKNFYPRPGRRGDSSDAVMIRVVCLPKRSGVGIGAGRKHAWQSSFTQMKDKTMAIPQTTQGRGNISYYFLIKPDSYPQSFVLYSRNIALP